jgi:hypothetical protein
MTMTTRSSMSVKPFLSACQELSHSGPRITSLATTGPSRETLPDAPAYICRIQDKALLTVCHRNDNYLVVQPT